MFVVIESSRSVSWVHHHSPYLRVLLLAIVVHLLLFALTPPFHFQPYQLNEPDKPMMVAEVPDEVEIPPEPEAVPLPRAIVPVDDIGNEEPVPQTMFDNIGDFPKQSIAPTTPGSVFVPYDEEPVPVHFETPVYPALAREAGFEGVVHIRVVIDTNGRVIDAAVYSSNVTVAMEKAALDAAKKCLFEPAKQNQTPVKVMIVIPFEFRLID